MAEQPEVAQLLQKLYNQITQHAETRFRYLSLNATDKLSGLLSNLAGAMVLFVFFILVLFFFSMGFAWWLGDLIGSRAGGFALAGLVFIPIAWLTFGWVRPFVQTKVIQILWQEDDDKTKIDNELHTGTAPTQGSTKN